jgi:outer membrane protein assembly factor BamD (BamD/ComL family)
MNKKWSQAEEKYTQVLERYPESQAAPEALYWRAVSHYKGTNDHTVLGQVAEEFKQKYQDSIWALKAIPWCH